MDGPTVEYLQDVVHSAYPIIHRQMPNRNFAVLTLFLLTAAGLSAQDTIADYRVKGVAIGISAPELVAEMMLTMPGLGSDAREMINQQSVKPYLMPPREADSRSVLQSYVISAAMEFYTNFRKNYKVNLSPDFVSLQLPQHGSPEIRQVLRFLVTDGTVPADFVPYGASRIPSGVEPPVRFRIGNYLQLFAPEARPLQKVFEIQKALMRGNPVIVQLELPESVKDVADTRFWLPPVPAGSTNAALFPFLVVSYNLDLDAFELMGPWGPEWGSDGYIWMKFEDFGRRCQEAFVLVPQKN